jgi:hypothetical protein
MPLFISDFTRYLNVEWKIRPDIWYPAFRLAGYPEKSVFGASLLKKSDSDKNCLDPQLWVRVNLF